MMQIRSSVKYSPIHGLGCFAEEDIKKGQLVWKFDPRLDLVINVDDLNNFPTPVIEFLRIYSYGQQEGNKRTMILCGDHARHMNHSETPNLLEGTGPDGENFAERDIKKGEELTCNYGLFDLNANDKLKSH